MNLVADESIDSGITEGLRKKGINIFSIAEESGGIKDTEVLELAVKNNALLITEDKDFGELAFRLKFQHGASNRQLTTYNLQQKTETLFVFTNPFNKFEEKKMKAQQYNKTYNIPFYFNDLLKLIKSLPIKDKLKIEKELEKETLIYRSQKLSEKVKENSLNMENIVAEIYEYRLITQASKLGFKVISLTQFENLME